MTYSSQALKAIIKTFVEENVDESIDVGAKEGESVIANKAIFEIESFLVELRNLHNINNRLDTSIASENILKEFSSVSSLDAYKSIDYQYNFLYHLAAEYIIDIDLYELIDSFIDKFKNQFKLADIVITNTGATRCKTNIRFALNDLRNMGLVLSRNPDNKRIWSPSILGLVALLNIRFKRSRSENWNYYKLADSLTPLKHIEKYIPNFYSHDPVLMQSLLMFKDPAYLYVYLNEQLDIALNENEKGLLNSIIKDFIDFTHVGLEITDKGIKMTKHFAELSKTFQQKLFSMEKENQGLHGKLFTHFRNKK